MIDKSRFRDEKNRYIVQGLFLEDRYNTDLAYYTLDGEDKTYKGRVYPSLKRLFIEEGDPTEYVFAKKYLFDWPHWQRMVRNRWLQPHIESWREELEISLRAEGIAAIINAAISNDHYQAAKWLADKGWDIKTKGRPSKEEIEGEISKEVQKEREFGEGFKLLELHQKGSNNG